MAMNYEQLLEIH